MGERGWNRVFNWGSPGGGGALDSSRVFIFSNRMRAEDMGTDVNRWMGVMVEVCGCSLWIDFIFPVKREVRSSG